MHPTSGIKTTKIEQEYTRITRNPSYLRGIYLQCHESTDLLLSTASVCKNLQNANLEFACESFHKDITRSSMALKDKALDLRKTLHAFDRLR